MGLGKNNNGISEALLVKRRATRLGMGHDVKEKHQHWWDHVYNRAVKNITVHTDEVGALTQLSYLYIVIYELMVIAL